MYAVSKRRLKSTIIALFFLGFLMLVFVSISDANWYILKRAEIKSTEGHRLIFESPNSKFVGLRFVLNRREKGVFLNKLPVYRVDSNDIRIIKKGKIYKHLKIRSGHYISWTISAYEIPSKELNEFINGQEVVFQYYREDGKIMEAIFLLDGIKEAVKEILY